MDETHDYKSTIRSQVRALVTRIAKQLTHCCYGAMVLSPTQVRKTLLTGFRSYILYKRQPFY